MKCEEVRPIYVGYVHRENVFGVVTEPDSGEFVYRADQQASADQKSQRQGSLKHRHSTKKTTVCAPDTGGWPSTLKPVHWVQLRHAEGRNEARECGCQSGRAEAEAKRRPTDGHSV